MNTDKRTRPPVPNTPAATGGRHAAARASAARVTPPAEPITATEPAEPAAKPTKAPKPPKPPKADKPAKITKVADVAATPSTPPTPTIKPPPPSARPRRPSVKARIHYRLDLTLSRGALAIIGWLAVIMIVVVVVAGAVVTMLHLSGVGGAARLGYPEAFWQSLLRVLGRGSFSADERWPTRIVTLIVTIIGIFLAGALIGLIATALNQKIANLRKGRSPVLERGHTLVLGWSPRLPVILSELVIANADQRHAAFVVLADRPKDDMEDELRRLVRHTDTTRVVCRTGDPGKPGDLELVHIAGARSVIVLAGEEGDAGVVKAVLAVRSIDPTFANTRVVAELESVDLAETLRSLTDQRIATVQADQVISRVTAQACHQAGLAGVFHELLDFVGDEIYFMKVPEVVGHSYRDVLRAFNTSSVLGVCRNGVVNLNPQGDYLIDAADEIIAISADDNVVLFTGFRDAPPTDEIAGPAFAEPPQRIALVGWSALGADVVRELDEFLGQGSVIDLMVDRKHFAVDEVVLPDLEHCSVQVHALASGPEAMLDVIADRDYDQAIVLGYRHRLKASQADARTLLTLLALHKAWAGKARRPRVVAEMLDRANVDIAQTTGVDDFIVSDELSSLMIAQVSERLELQDVFHELFDAEGSFISLHPAALYAPARDVSFESVVAAAAERGESALGYRIGRTAVVLNPPKSTVVTLAANDQVLVLGPRATRPAPTATAAATAMASPSDTATVADGREPSTASS
jgi:ion channel POLLUX/CASTOR